MDVVNVGLKKQRRNEQFFNQMYVLGTVIFFSFWIAGAGNAKKKKKKKNLKGICESNLC